MVKPFIFVLIMLIISSCNDDNEGEINKVYEPEIEGRYWSSEFYHYRNVYKFINDHQGICFEHQIARTCPIDLEKHNIAKDSMLIIRETPFEYHEGDSILTLYISQNNEDTTEVKHFLIKELFVNDFILQSKHEYTYGKEIVYPEPEWFECCE